MVSMISTTDVMILVARLLVGRLDLRIQVFVLHLRDCWKFR